MGTSVVFEGSPGLTVQTPAVRFVGAARADVVATAARERADGAERIELCGGLGPVPLAEAQQALGPGVEVGAVMYGVESLEVTAAFKQRFAAGESPRGAFLYPGPEGDRVDHGTTAFVAVPDAVTAGVVAAQLVAEGVELVELYGGLDPAVATAVIEAVAGRASVGLALYPRG